MAGRRRHYLLTHRLLAITISGFRKIATASKRELVILYGRDAHFESLARSFWRIVIAYEI